MKEKKLLIPFFFFILTFVIVIGWFRDGRPMSGGEESFSIFNQRSIFFQTNLWQETGTGYPMPAYIARFIPTVFVFALRLLSLHLIVIQVSFYFFVILFGLINLFYFQKEVLDKEENLVFVVSSLFYLFNLYGMTQIWGRFLYAHMILWAYLPLFLLLWIKWLKENRLKTLLMFIAANLIFSGVYGQPAFILTLALPVALFGVLELWKARRKIKDVFELIFRSFIFFISWFVSSIWWLYPNLLLSKSSFSERGDLKSNLDSLVSVSQYFRNWDLLLLRQSFLLGKSSIFFDFYSKEWVYLISVVILLTVVAGLWFSRKNKNWSFLFSLAFLGWFISKGSNIPFGLPIFEFLFRNFAFTQSLRNSYEKFGVVWLLPYSIFFALGLKFIYQKINQKISGFLAVTIFTLACVVLIWPMWTGNVFAKNLHVSIPSYYNEVNTYFNDRNDDGRILQLPVISGDSVGYDWGYRGVEPSEFLFDKPSVSKILRAKYFDNKYLNLYREFVNKKDYNKQLEEMNIKYFVLHNDLIPEASGTSSSAETKQIIGRNPKIHFLKSFGELDIYEYTETAQFGLFVTDGKNAPVLEYKKLSPTRYVVNIKNAEESFNLIFKETYNDFWEARIGGEKIENHSFVYDYANVWEIEKKGNYNIDIVFKVWPWE